MSPKFTQFTTFTRPVSELTYMQIALLGLGLMGRALAARLLERGHALTLWNRTPLDDAYLTGELAGTRVVAEAVEAVSAAPLVLCMLSDANALREVLLSKRMVHLLPGRVVLNMATIAPEEARSLAEALARAGGEYVECPVLGSTPEARSGRLLLMFGGNRARFDALLPLLSDLGTAPRHVGEVGQAAAMKLALNQLIASLTSAFALSLGLVQREGVAVEDFMAVLRESALYAPTFDKKLDRLLARDFERPNFPLKHLLKDTRLFTRAAHAAGLDTHMLVGVQHVLEHALHDGLADKDYSALYQAIVPPRD